MRCGSSASDPPNEDPGVSGEPGHRVRRTGSGSVLGVCVIVSMWLTGWLDMTALVMH